jgi:hypothetical protein
MNDFAKKLLLWIVVLIVACIAYQYGILPLLAALALPAIATTLICCVLVLLFCWWSLVWFGIS